EKATGNKMRRPTNPDEENSRPDAVAAYTRSLLDRLAERRNTLSAFRARSNKRRTLAQRIADSLQRRMGSVPFLAIHLCLFALWFAMNLGFISHIVPFDPYPFAFLTMVLTLE